MIFIYFFKSIKLMLDNYDFCLNLVKHDGLLLKYLNFNYKNNYNIVLTAVKNNGLAIRYASNKLKNNFNIAFNAFQNNNIGSIYVYQYISKNLKENLFIINKLYQTYINTINRNIYNDKYNKETLLKLFIDNIECYNILKNYLLN